MITFFILLLFFINEYYGICEILPNESIKQQHTQLLHGDLLFYVENMATASDFSKSIVESTKKYDTKAINHVAIVCIENNKTYIIEATPQKGVWMCSLDTFINNAPKSNNIPLLLHGRIKGDVDIHKSMENAKKRIGLKYDYLFSNTDDAFYCSELIQKSYVDSKGNLIFKPIKMSFHNENGVILPYWIKYYAKYGMAVPDGEAGSNPSNLSKHERMTIYSFSPLPE